MATGTMKSLFPELTKRDCKGAFTANEMSEETGLCVGAVQNRIRAGIKAGVLAYVGRKDGVGVDGRRKHSPLYRPVTTKAR